jgi:nucleoid-associated protein YgaU
MPKYIGRETVRNEQEEYKELFDDRGVTSIEHYETFILNESNYDVSYSSLEHVWKRGDKLYKLAFEYYGVYKYWWVIALYNNKPTDAHFNDGDVIAIPIDPARIVADITG